MPRRSQARNGQILEIKKSPILFSFWPVKRTTRRYGLCPSIFASDPWNIIRHSILSPSISPGAKRQAMAFCEQAHDYFTAATTAGIVAAKPVLLYYSFLNLAKAYVLVRGHYAELDNRVKHGLTEGSKPPRRKELAGSELTAIPSCSKNINMFHEFLNALTDKGVPPGGSHYRVTDLLPQILQGHQLWCAAKSERERFIRIARVDVIDDGAAQLWLNICVYEDILTRIGVTRGQLLDETGLKSEYEDVQSDEVLAGHRLLKFQQKEPIGYEHRPSDYISQLVQKIKPFLWVNVLDVPPYKDYCLYRVPSTNRECVLPQLASVYALFYYLGSVTRYRPHKFDNVISGSFGAQLQEIIAVAPGQFIYLMASEFAQQEILSIGTV